MNDTIIEGQIYKHFKGGVYRIIAVVKHTETKELLVCYKDLATGEHYIRPLDGEKGFRTDTPEGPRFIKI